MLYKRRILTISIFSIVFLLPTALQAMVSFAIPCLDYTAEEMEDNSDDFFLDEHEKAECVIAAKNFLLFLQKSGIDRTQQSNISFQRCFVLKSEFVTSTKEIQNGLRILQEEDAEKKESERKEFCREKPILCVPNSPEIPAIDTASTTDQPQSLSETTPYMPWLLKKKETDAKISPLMERLLQDKEKNEPLIIPQTNLAILPESEPQDSEDIFNLEL